MPLAASIDVGSNTVRLLAAEVEDGRIVKEVLNLRDITRLGEGLGMGGSLKPEARDRTLAVLREYASRLDAMKVKNVSIIATEALRKANDSAAFISDVKSDTGLDIELITGEDEAKRTLLGVRAGMAGAVSGGMAVGEKLLVDIGGGSTEVVTTPDWEEFKAVSLPLGAVTLYERFLVEDPPTPREMGELVRHCLAPLGALAGMRPKGGWSVLVGTAGTVTTLAAVDMRMDVYDPDRITGHRMSRDTVARLLSRFMGMSKESRRLLAGLEAGREDIILSGTAILGAVMDLSGADYVVACDYGLREGNLLRHCASVGCR
ncbi:MAG: Ppx/GppA family phosphatase [Nitrospirae bacterium]|nr:Ppx/GppA family phosphatase [Nitrospirota bacterium]